MKNRIILDCCSAGMLSLCRPSPSRTIPAIPRASPQRPRTLLLTQSAPPLNPPLPPAKNRLQPETREGFWGRVNPVRPQEICAAADPADPRPHQRTR